MLEDGGSQREAVAALLHDVLEDTDTSRRAVRKRFGRKVARIVDACTDVGRGGTHTAKNWMRSATKDARTLARPEHPDVGRAGEGGRLTRERAVPHR